MEYNKKLKIFYIFPVLYVLSAYMALMSFLAAEKTFLVITPLISGILNIIMCIRCCKPVYRGIMISSSALVKYCLIPFFIIGGFFAACSFISGLLLPMPPIFVTGIVLDSLLCLAGWLVIAFGSPYTISYVVLLIREGKISKGMAVLHIMLQFFFTLDVIDVMCLSFKAHRNIKLTIAVIALLVISIIALVVFILFIVFQIVLPAVQ